MAYTFGTSHSGLTGSGTIVVTAPVGLLLTVTTLAPGTTADLGPPVRYRSLGRVTIGDVNGWLPAIDIEHQYQLELYVPIAATVVAYNLVAGVVLTIRELLEVAPAVPTNQLMPWDRAAVTILRSSFGGIPGGSGATTAWTYTVPAGKKLWVAGARAAVHRSVAASVALNAQAYVDVGGVNIAQAVVQNNIVGFIYQDPGPQAGLTLLAGQIISGWYQNSDTGGTVMAQSLLNALLFDA